MRSSNLLPFPFFSWPTHRHAIRYLKLGKFPRFTAQNPMASSRFSSTTSAQGRDQATEKCCRTCRMPFTLRHPLRYSAAAAIGHRDDPAISDQNMASCRPCPPRTPLLERPCLGQPCKWKYQVGLPIGSGRKCRRRVLLAGAMHGVFLVKWSSNTKVTQPQDVV